MIIRTYKVCNQILICACTARQTREQISRVGIAERCRRFAAKQGHQDSAQSFAARHQGEKVGVPTAWVGRLASRLPNANARGASER